MSSGRLSAFAHETASLSSLSCMGLAFQTVMKFERGNRRTRQKEGARERDVYLYFL